MAEVFSESLAYPQMKRRSVGARSFRMKLPPSNSTSFTPGQTIQFDLPSNLPGQYIDFSSLYIKIKMENDATAALSLDRCGAFGLIKRLQISTAGAQIADINNWNVLACAMLDTDSSADWRSSYGAAMLGTEGDALRGVTVAASASRVFAIPLVLNPLFNTTPHRLIPLGSLSSIQIRLTLDSVASAFLSAGAPGVEYKEVECVAMITELSPDAQRAVDAATGGKYNILANSFMNSTASLPVNATQLTQNLGYSFSSMERIIAVHRPTDTIAAQAAYSLGNRTTSGLEQYAYMINSELYPSRYVLVDAAAAESTAEMLIADHALVDFNKGAGFQTGVVAGSLAGTSVGAFSGIDPAVVKSGCYTLKDGAGTQAGAAGVASNIGTFVIGTDFENGLSVNRSATIYSGVSTIASNVQWVGTYANVHEAAQVDFFAQFTVLLSLDMRGSGVFSVSV